MNDHNLPVLETTEDLSNYANARASAATTTPVLQYPVLGDPLPNQPKVCKVLVHGRVCGVGGHSAKTHHKTMSLSTRALTHATWILEHLESLARQEALKQCRAFVDLLVDLEYLRQRQRQKGFAGETSELRAVLVMYNTVKKHYDAVFRNDTAGAPKSSKRHFRSTVYVLNSLLPVLCTKVPPPETFILPEKRNLVLYLFPETPHLMQLCEVAFREASPDWTNKIERTIQGHRGSCKSDENCTCGSLDVLKAEVQIQGYTTCAICGSLGHQKRSCTSINTTTHVAIGLATLIDDEKNRRIDPRTAHLSLYNAYHMIVAMLYEWVVYNRHDWEIHGKQRLTSTGKGNPFVILQLFNYVVATLKNHYPSIGDTMGVVYDPSHLDVEAAHAYDSPVVKTARPAVKALTRQIKETTEQFQDEDFYRPTMSPQRRKDVSHMIHSSAIFDRRIMLDADTLALGMRFGLDG